ncbi:MAG TPA: branched-chain amino acid ABC transporter substrate-binding protein [Candidatus Methylomirabilis sp.]|nr:branched-chain amino acid ABC transporter substrate-binding protein [Candidatus Methylomirabilis sp.]
MKHHSYGRLVVIAVALVALAIPAAVLAGQAKGTIKIASQSPLSGEQAALGEGIKLGAQLAVEKFKGPVEKLGFKVEFVPFDDQAKPDVGVANAKSIVADPDILLVDGHLNSGVALPSSEIYKEANLAMVSPANTNPLITDRNYRNVSRICGRDDVQGDVGANFAYQTLKIKSAYVLHDKTLYGQGVAEFFRDNASHQGVKILGFEGTEEKANFDPIITPIKAKNPDLVYFGGIYNQGAILFKQAREKGVKASFMGPDGMDSSELVKIAGNTVVGMNYTTVVGPPTVYPEAKNFIKEFKEKFKKDPEPFAAQAYDVAALGLKAIEDAIKANKGNKPTRTQVTDAIRQIKNFKGVTGTINFDEKGDPLKAKYFIIKVASDDPAKWGANPVVKTLDIAAPPLKKKK